MPNAIDVHRIADQIEESFQQILAAVEILTMQQTQPAPSGSSLATGGTLFDCRIYRKINGLQER